MCIYIYIRPLTRISIYTSIDSYIYSFALENGFDTMIVDTAGRQVCFCAERERRTLQRFEDLARTVNKEFLSRVGVAAECVGEGVP